MSWAIIFGLCCVNKTTYVHLTHKFPDNFSPQDWYGIRNSTTSSAYIKQMHEILAAIEQPKKRIGPLKGMKHKYVLIF